MSYDIKERFLLRAPKQLVSLLKTEAKMLGVSLNTLIVMKLSKDAAWLANLKSTPPLTHQHSLNELTSPFKDALYSYIEKITKTSLGSGLLGVVLFGSAANNTLRRNSDIDLLFVIDHCIAIDRDSYSVFQNEQISGHTISPLIVYPPDSESKFRSLWLEVAIGGIVLTEREFLISQTLIQIRNLIESGQAVRKVSYGVPYWTIKQNLQTEAS